MTAKAGPWCATPTPSPGGHRHLVEYAAARCPHLYVFVLSEETGDFPAADRLELVRRGTADLPNVDVVPGGDYIISRATFPAYFLQGDPEQARCDLELTLFGKRIAPGPGHHPGGSWARSPTPR